MALTEGDDVIGAFHALLPWNMLFPLMDDHFLGGRGNSHFFIMNEGGYILHHPLVPGDFQSPVSVATIESPDILDRVNGSVLSLLQYDSPFHTYIHVLLSH